MLGGQNIGKFKLKCVTYLICFRMVEIEHFFWSVFLNLNGELKTDQKIPYS